jgi:hypothetical protein
LKLFPIIQPLYQIIGLWTDYYRRIPASIASWVFARTQRFINERKDVYLRDFQKINHTKKLNRGHMRRQKYARLKAEGKPMGKTELPPKKKELTVDQSGFQSFLIPCYWVQIVKGACGASLRR